MQEEASEEVNLKPKARAERLARDKAATNTNMGNIFFIKGYGAHIELHYF